MKPVKFHAARIKSEPRILSLEIPTGILDSLLPLYEKSDKYHGGYLKVEIGLPFRGRSTGQDSQNHAINGRLMQLWEGSGFKAQYSWQTFRAWMKKKLAPAWPCEFDPDGEPVPLSEADMSVEQASAVLQAVDIVAMEWGIELL